MKSKTFQDVEVWKRAHQFVLDIYKFTEKFPRHELFGLSSQFRRAAVSVPANFAEGFKKRSKPDKVRFYNIAQGSLEECRYYLILARDLGYGNKRANQQIGSCKSNVRSLCAGHPTSVGDNIYRLLTTGY